MSSLLGLTLVSAAWLLWPKDNHDATSTDSSPAKTGPYVRSMEGTVPDGKLLPEHRAALATTGATTTPLAYGELKRLFDYYLSAVGEQSIDAISQQIQLALDQRLPPEHTAAAKRLLGLYLAFKLELVALDKTHMADASGAQALRKRFVAMQDLRAQFFSAEEVKGMFGFEDLYDTDALARLEIDQNPDLSTAQKRARIAALDAAMPATLRADREAPRAVMLAEQKVLEMRAKGASDDDIYRLRAQTFDAQAASRLAALDRDEQAWKTRIARYLEVRSHLIKSMADAPENERQAALDQLQQAQFTAMERPRLAAYN